MLSSCPVVLCECTAWRTWHGNEDGIEDPAAPGEGGPG